MQKVYDVIIVGSGIVGATLALILAKAQLKVALIEAATFIQKNVESERHLALAYSSRLILEWVGAWDSLSSIATPIADIHVSDKGRFGTARIRCADENLSALGYVLPDDVISLQLHSLLLTNKQIDLIQPAQFSSFVYQHKKVKVKFQQDNCLQEIVGYLLVAADGYRSPVRESQDILVDRREYHQTAIICNVQLKRSHQGVAYERFTEQGPLAMLPLADNNCALIWTVGQQQVSSLLAMSDDNFLSQLQLHFGYRLGKFQTCTRRQGLDLQQIIAREQIRPGMVLLGNAVHTLHPVAGQGLNLALRDLAVLAEEINYARKNAEILGELAILKRYILRREQDQKNIIALTHSLIGIFSNSLLPVILARNTGLLLLDRIISLKKLLTKRTLGFAGKVPRLACGMALD